MNEYKKQEESLSEADIQTNGGTEVVFIVDRSGSMGGSEEDTIGGYNAMLEKQRDGVGRAFITTILFDNQYEILHDGVDIKSAVPISEKEYFVRGRTALLDAVGRTIGKIDDRLMTIANGGMAGRAPKIIFVIITDGLENASLEFSRMDVKRMIENRKALGWEFIYLGADISSALDADSIGIRDDRRYFYGKEKQREVCENMSENINFFRSAKDFPDDWKDRLNAKIEGIDKQAQKQRFISIESAAGHYILDTGSPVSLGLVPEVEICGKEYPLTADNPIISELRKHLGGDVAGIIGMDILNKHDIGFIYDKVSEKIKFKFGGLSDTKPEDGEEIKLETTIGIPILSAVLAGGMHKFFLDTGAEVSYVRPDFIQGAQSCGHRKDFYPAVGAFDVDLYSMDFEISGVGFTLEAGTLPGVLNMLLPVDIDGIIGMDLLRQVELYLGFKSNKYWLRKI